MKALSLYLAVLVRGFIMAVMPFIILALVLSLPPLGFLALVIYLSYKDIMFSTDKK